LVSRSRKSVDAAANADTSGGAPTGFRLALRHPERIVAIISQNGNAYEEGLSEGWNPIRAYWQEPSQANRNALRNFLAPETTIWQYTHGVTDRTRVSPDGYSLDNFHFDAPRRRRNSARPFRRLQDERGAISKVSKLFPRTQAAASGGLGQKRPVLSAGRSRSIQA
jgi:pimeloyl-ACP methyl ester carboxylesterase